MNLNRREAVSVIGAAAIGGVLSAGENAREPAYALATFKADVTPPLGHPLIAGWRAPAKTIKDRLSARGLVLAPQGKRGDEKPVVLVSIDWCELRNDSYDRWREALAEAAGTTRERVLVTCVHQHDAPYADLTAQRLLDEAGLEDSMFIPDFHEAAVKNTAAALKSSLDHEVALTHIGTGEAKVEGVACNRRVQLEGQPPRFNRYSFTRDEQVRNADDGVIDPLLKTLTFFSGDRAVAAISVYATHPMSYYGRGEVSFDFTGMAREMRQRENPDVFQIYMSGCAGDVTAAKYNDGNEAGRLALAEKLADAMKRAETATKRHAFDSIGFRNVALRMKPELEGKLAPEFLKKTIANEKATQQARSTASLGLSWQRRAAAGQPIDLPVVDFGACQLMLLPAEAFVAYQLAAQKMRPDSFVLTPAYGECAPGYIPTAKTREEGFVREHSYCWVAPGEEQAMLAAMKKALAQ